MEAAFDESRCGWCDRMILEGDDIGLLEPDGDWVHLECAEEEAWPEDEDA